MLLKYDLTIRSPHWSFGSLRDWWVLPQLSRLGSKPYIWGGIVGAVEVTTQGPRVMHAPAELGIRLKQLFTGQLSQSSGLF